MRFYTELKILFPMLNKKAYYEANKSHLGVGLRRFQQWFDSWASDKELIKAKAKPKPEKIFKQNKVEFQAERTTYTPENKLDLIRQYDRQKAVNPGNHQLWIWKVLPLTRWKDQRLAERDEFSDEDDSEDEESDVEDITIPVKSRKRKLASGDKKAKKPRLRIPKKSCSQRTCVRASRSTPCPPRRPRHKPKSSQIASKN